jgi:hypothetical protein
VPADAIADGLPEIVQVLAPVYELFDLHVLRHALVEDELREMRRNVF